MSISYIERFSGEIKEENPPSKGMLNFLYGSPLGKLSLYLLFKRKLISSLGGWYMNSRLSKGKVKRFIKEENINLDDFLIPDNGFKNFNDFFYRKLKLSSRELGTGLVSPADGKILTFPSVGDTDKFFVKGSGFSVTDFLDSTELGEKYKDGSLSIIRLAPVDYHRYHFPADGQAGPSIKIKGDYYSVSPIALRKSLKIFLQNKREYCELRTKEFGDIIICDVGATMVGTIIQSYKPNTSVEKGDEKGYFAFGGSTLVIISEKGKVDYNQDLLDNTSEGLETTIKMGESIASSIQVE